ncbi:MAG: glycosyltransferase family 2 protein [Solirubrobacteraceae bacterium]
MTHLISVITAAHPPTIPYLRDAYDSLERQALPPDWDWQWVVQEDGQTGQVAAALPDDPRISAGSSRKGGPGVARTMALARATGSLVKVLDADDQLLPDTLARDITVLTDHPDVGWTTSKALDLLPDGSTVAWDQDDPPEGRLDSQHVFQYWLDHAHRAQVLPSTVCIHRELLLAVGGWMALPASEDTGMLLAASVLSPGYFIADNGLLYRKWPGQSTAQAAHVDPNERDDRMTLIANRVRALQRSLTGFAADTKHADDPDAVPANHPAEHHQT